MGGYRSIGVSRTTGEQRAMRRGECWKRGAGAPGMPLASVWSVGDKGLWRVYKKMSVQNLSFSASMK